MDKSDIALKSAEHSDLKKMHRWLNLGVILKNFGGREKIRPSLVDIENEYGQKSNSNLLMIHYKNEPVGFIDVFNFSSETNIRHGFSESEENVYSFDIVVGEI